MAEGLTSTQKGLPTEMLGVWNTSKGPFSEKIMMVSGTPNNFLTSVTGSDIALNVIGGVFYIGDITNGKGGSSWTALKTV